MTAFILTFIAVVGVEVLTIWLLNRIVQARRAAQELRQEKARIERLTRQAEWRLNHLASKAFSSMLETSRHEQVPPDKPWWT